VKRDPRFDEPYLGVLGGMGPLASAAFMDRLTALVPAEVDQEHIPTILWSDPRIPDRTDAKLNGGEDPLPWLVNGASKLKQSGAGAIVIPCNSAHLWFDELSQAVDLPILHIVTAVASNLRRLGIDRARIGLMGASATLKMGLYQGQLEALGYECIMPREEELERYCMRPIRLVKANRVEEAYPLARECIELLRSRGAEAIVLGCTEYPLAVPHARRPELGLPLLDSIDALALAAIEWHAGTRALRASPRTSHE
jgi:aspartate racemase